jgi:hypothetical protein
MNWPGGTIQRAGDTISFDGDLRGGFAGRDVSAPTTRVIRQQIITMKAILASGVRMGNSLLEFYLINSRPHNSLRVCVCFNLFLVVAYA